MKAARVAGSFFSALRRFSRQTERLGALPPLPGTPKIGLALGGGFARGIAHAGILKVFEQRSIPIHCITGVSAGSIVASAFASGASPDEIARAGCNMRFADVARWSICRMGFVANERMKRFLERLLKKYRFEEMEIPLGIVATDLCTGEPVRFRDEGDVILPVRASCSYPGLFRPTPYGDRLLVDGAMSMEIPALLARQLGATHVVSVHLPALASDRLPRNMFQVVNRCFQIFQTRTENHWREHSDLVISPEVSGVEWDGFGSGPALLKIGEAAALEALPKIEAWFSDRAAPPEITPALSSTPA